MFNSLRPLVLLAALPMLISAQESDRIRPPVSAFHRPFAVPEMSPANKDVKPFEYKDVGNQIPDYR